MRPTDKLPARLGVHLLEPRDNPAGAFAAFGAAAGGLPLVEVQRPDGVAVARFAAYDVAGFRGGVRAAVGELDGDRDTVEVVTAAGPGGGPHVKVFRLDLANDNAVTEVASFFAFDERFTGGVNVAVGNVGGPDLRQEIVVGADAGGGPHVRTFQLNGGAAVPVSGPLGDFYAFEPQFGGGVRVAAGELDGNPANGDELVAAAGPGGGPRVKVWRADGAVISDYYAFRQDFGGGVNVAVDRSAGNVGRLLVDGEMGGVSQRQAGLNDLAAGQAGVAANFAGNAGQGGTFSGVNATTNGLTGGNTTSGNVTTGNDAVSNTSSLVSSGRTAAQLPAGISTAGTGGIGLGAGNNFGRQFGTFATPSFGVFGSPGAAAAFPVNGFGGFTGGTFNTAGLSGVSGGTGVSTSAGGLGSGTVVF